MVLSGVDKRHVDLDQAALEILNHTQKVSEVSEKLQTHFNRPTFQKSRQML